MTLKNNIKKLLIAIIMPLTFIGCTDKDGEAKEEVKEINISIAASLVNPMDEVIKSYEKENNIKINVNSGGSGTLEKQIEEGAEVDLFISAAVDKIDNLEEKDMIEKNTRFDLLKNDLVLIISKDNEELLKGKSLTEIYDYLKSKDEKIAIGTPETVPAGAYAQESLNSLGLYEFVKDNIVYTKDVTQVVNYVENKEAIAGIVYASDATSSKNSLVVYTFSDDSHSDIVYTAAVIKDAKNKDAAKVFLDYLKEDKSKEIFKSYGFK